MAIVENLELFTGDTKESVESQLTKRILDLQQAMTSTLENDGDDSSDEEDVESTISEFNYRAFNNNYFPQLAHAIGLKLYWSADVNKLYNNEKYTLLNGNTINFTQDECERSISTSFDDFINCLFEYNEFSLWNKKYLAYFKKIFLQQCANEIKETKKIFVEIFQKNIRLLLKLSIIEASSTLPLDLYNPISKFYNLFKNFMSSLQINYEDKYFCFSARSLAHELPKINSEAILAIVREYLTTTGMINNTATFVKKQLREKILQEHITKETNNFCLEILRLLSMLKTSNTHLSTFLTDNKLSFLEGYLEESIKAWIGSGLVKGALQFNISGGVSKFTTVYTLQSLNPFFESSFFGELERTFRSALKQKLDTMTLFNFYKKFASNITACNHFLQRSSLPNNFAFTHNGPLHSLIFVRLSNRSQTRLIRQKREDAAQINSSFTPEVTFRSVTFTCIKTTALERQELTNNGIRKDIVPNMKKYPDIYLELERIRKLYPFDDSKMAIWVRQVLMNQSIEELKLLIKPLNKEICQFLANFTYVFFISESTRNPACWITHQIILDLVIGKHLIWQQVLTETTADNVTHIPSMPMATTHAVRGARLLSEEYWNMGIQTRRYCYPGGSGSDNENALKRDHILMVENFIMKQWFDLYIKKQPQSVEEAAKILCDSVKSWYGVNIQLTQVNHFSPLRQCEWLIAYRNDKEKKKLKTLLGNSAVHNLGEEPLDLIAQYCEGGSLKIL